MHAVCLVPSICITQHEQRMRVRGSVCRHRGSFPTQRSCACMFPLCSQHKVTRAVEPIHDDRASWSQRHSGDRRFDLRRTATWLEWHTHSIVAWQLDGWGFVGPLVNYLSIACMFFQRSPYWRACENRQSFWTWRTRTGLRITHRPLRIKP